MINKLVDGVRELRQPLATGYVLLYVALLTKPDQLRSVGKDEEFLALRQFLEAAGSGTKAALVTFAAVLVGGVVNRLFDRPLSTIVSKATLQDDPSRHLVQARAQSVAFEAEAVPGYAAIVRSREEAIDRMLGEFDFRLTLVWLLTFAGVVTGRVGGGLYWITVLIPLVLAVDCQLIAQQMRRPVAETQLDAQRSFVPGFAIAKEGPFGDQEKMSLLKLVSDETLPKHSFGRRYVADPEGMPLRFWEYSNVWPESVVLAVDEADPDEGGS